MTTGFCEKAHAAGLYTVAADPLSLCLLQPPGEFGLILGSTQRLVFPLGYMVPAAYFATRSEYKRQVPGRIVGVSKDVHA